MPGLSECRALVEAKPKDIALIETTMEQRRLKGLTRPLTILNLKLGVIWLIVAAISFATARWIGAWAVLVLVLGTLIAFSVVQGRTGSHHVIWTILTTQCPECGMWPMIHKGSPSRDDNRGFLICEKCQIQWDLGRGMGSPGNDYNPTGLTKNISDIIDKQIQNNNPPETRQTIERLTKEGRTPDEARQLISTAAIVEVYHIVCDHKPFDERRYVWNLAHLPRKPWDERGREFYRLAK